MSEAAQTASAPGPVLFVRYAFPPNQRGSCGPPDSGQFFEYGVTCTVDPGLVELARQFTGAWPYLELIADATGTPDPLDRRVVEAYWIGNDLLDRVGARAMGDSVEERFRRRTGRFGPLADSVLAGGMPHHSYHVFCVYPWLGLLGGGGTAAEHALTVLDRCRIRWGRVRAVEGDQVVVDTRALTWDGRCLGLGPAETEIATAAVDGVGFVSDLRPGDQVALHWDWVCDRLTPQQLAALHRYTRHHLDIANHRLEKPGLAKHLG
ncbi:DUF6390 family protein [Saccharopolyspora phatthalungensis]|uniref:Uncharacterized protein n=1 Tax=Saccharopolyspora phatthalungensis TaxID=664693 RepID=A0A840QEH2_9PSEU|nr:DUF6390 family protein [Saccharopolyspora phatthalungensis]MBB5157078.1 hypothetical protein [Saccharopolyspora phatthalungensis]